MATLGQNLKFQFYHKTILDTECTDKIIQFIC